MRQGGTWSLQEGSCGRAKAFVFSLAPHLCLLRSTIHVPNQNASKHCQLCPGSEGVTLSGSYLLGLSSLVAFSTSGPEPWGLQLYQAGEW